MTEYLEFEEDFESASIRGGYFTRLWMLPLVVVLVGLLIGFLLSGNVVLKASDSFINSSIQLSTNSNADNALIAMPINSHDRLSDLFTPEVLYWRIKINEWSEKIGLDPNLIATVMQIESCGDPRALSSAGAMGLFQVMPFHFNNSDDPFEPETNALRGMAYLKQSLDASNGDVHLALAGYNGGISVIQRSELSWAVETQRYTYWGSGIYEEASLGLDTSVRLQEWISRGGASLCMQAANRLGLDP